MTPALSIQDVTMDFGATRALDAVNLDVGPGRFTCLLGPSGCGKTTLLRSIAGIARPTQGQIRIGGRRVDDDPPEKRNLGMVFQTYALFPHMTVRQNVRFGLEMRRVARDEARRRVDWALDLVGLGAFADRLPRALSGGQQQRVALARAVVVEPDLLLFDEPLSNLDARLRDSLREDLRALQKRLGITSVYVTHDQAEAMAMADEIVVMNGGRIVERGDPVTLYRAPRFRFTADFLGLTNVIPVDTDGRKVRLPWGAEHPLEQPRAPGPAAVAIRPEDLALARVTNGQTPDAVITDAVFLGATVHYRLEQDGQTLRAAASGGVREILRPGQPVQLTAPALLHTLEDHADV